MFFYSVHIRFILLLFSVFLYCVNASAIELYRADSRTPEDVENSGGILSRGQSESYERGTPININLFDHATGAPSGNTRYDDGYVSTTRTLSGAHNIGQNMFGGINEYYIYVIVGAPNMFDVNGVLRRYSPHPYEQEVAALGGIPLSQIVGWYRVSFGAIEGGMIRNPNYRGGLFRGLSIAPNSDGYRLAGFPDGHPAWRQEPWRNYAPAQCFSELRSIGCSDIIDTVSKNYLSNYKVTLKHILGLFFLSLD
ncbi:enterotoxin A family protein [Escherichia coli]|uniref:enterotoxin A family protein n=1 Tax=Escherichia coli TaxID=562 RepID=UPI00136C9175|nr:enterotoxin A family protein [Escherichia coli]MEB6310532.1 enterotoxin A family protein [Escherichia coli]MXE06322.1 Heat-labile enterotoxin IIA, A chain [Escherichia coli]